MAKKTKKEKIIADQRRLLNLKRGFTTPLELPQANQKTETAKVKEITDQTSTLYSYPIQLIRKDLTKTLLLCILAISFELALYLFIEKKISLPFGF